MIHGTAFQPRLLGAWIVGAALVFACSFYFMTLDEHVTRHADRTGPSTFSSSALGHAVWFETLDALAMKPVQSRADSPGKVSAGGVLILAEPPGDKVSLQAARQMLGVAPMLVVFPKRAGKPDPNAGLWISEVSDLPIDRVKPILALFDAEADIVRPKIARTWSTNVIGIDPVLKAPQLIRSTSLKPIVAGPEGILVGAVTVQNQLVWILSDPDVVANHGIGVGDNAVFAVALIDRLRASDGNVVFDETLHGFFTRPAHPIHLLFQFPFVLVTIQAMIAVALFVWAGTVRVGVPLVPALRLRIGKVDLIESGAALLAYGGQHRFLAQRYVDATLRDLGRQLHAPSTLDSAALLEWLDRVGRLRDSDPSILKRHIDRLPADSSESAALSVVTAFHRFKRDMIDGPRAGEGDPRRR